MDWNGWTLGKGVHVCWSWRIQEHLAVQMGLLEHWLVTRGEAKVCYVTWCTGHGLWVAEECAGLRLLKLPWNLLEHVVFFCCHMVSVILNCVLVLSPVVSSWGPGILLHSGHCLFWSGLFEEQSLCWPRPHCRGLTSRHSFWFLPHCLVPRHIWLRRSCRNAKSKRRCEKQECRWKLSGT